MEPGACISEHQRGREEKIHGRLPPEQMEPGLSFFERPDLQLVSEDAELCRCKKILKFRRGRRHTAHDLVATNAGKHDTIALRGRHSADLRRSAAIVAGSWYEAAVRRFKQ